MDRSDRRDDRRGCETNFAVDGGRDDADDGDSPLQEAVAGVVTALTLLVAFGLLALEVPFFWVAFPVGFGGVLPAAVAFARYYERNRGRTEEDTEPESDALETLRRRYARDEIDEAEFERRLDALLRTESVEDARADAERRRDRRERERDR
ncbi:SHOCT domain-containing protein [Halorarum halobium]|uniref:SHOCT domain-containing protein n=1 Tax=Halorarum halobium TaxID=3075121 RepID=UPI0028A8C80D|nr:SHOCT domain-containing protein [Halobaculum sp. XH14]